MTRLLSGTHVGDRPHRLQPPQPVLDDATRELLDQAEARGYARGRQDGAADAVAAHDAAARQAAEAAASALQHAKSGWMDVERKRATEMVALARQMAVAVLAREVREDGELVLRRLAEAASGLDHGPFTMHVSEADHAVVAAGASALGLDSEIRVDPGLAPGDARISGPWSQADLTLEAMLDVVSAILESMSIEAPSERPVGPLAVHRMDT